MRTIDEIIVHCTATPEGRDVTVAQIDAWHRRRGFNGIGYHYVVMLDGTVAAGRAVALAGAHCRGHNARSVGVCYVGGMSRDMKRPLDTRTPQQKTALRQLLQRLRRRFPAAAIHGHRDYAAKACPCFDATAEYRDL